MPRKQDFRGRKEEKPSPINTISMKSTSPHPFYPEQPRSQLRSWFLLDNFSGCAKSTMCSLPRLMAGTTKEWPTRLLAIDY